jgi:hypothetical protein
MTNKSTGVQENEPPRKPYETPRLEVYGDIRAVTEAVGMTGSADGAVHGQNKTG